ncbi:MAG: hypothetical protein HFH47_01075 [Bacilli bacterium]|nr:hypothetical protein [Bacilli bacterium]
MTKKSKSLFPKGFFQEPRPKISMKEALKDVIPIKWPKEILEGKKKVFFVSAKEKNKM